MPWKPSVPGEIPTLGWYAIDWMHEYLAQPAIDHYEPFIPYREQEDFILRWYALNPRTGRFLYERALLGRPRGWGKSPMLAGLCILEGLGDILFDGWDADGQPVGRPWSTRRTPLVWVSAVSEEQTDYTWQPLLEMIREHPTICDDFPGLEPYDSVVNLPRGFIKQRTASGRTQKGGPVTFAVMDQTEEWVPSNGGPDLADKIRMNVAKNGGRSVEAPNAYLPGDGSVAEDSHEFRKAIEEGRARDDSLLVDHREADPDTDFTNRRSAIKGLREAYGDSSAHPKGCIIHTPPCKPGHVDLEPLLKRALDPSADEATIKSDILNMVTNASDGWLSKQELDAAYRDVPWPTPTEPCVLGFDGSKGRVKGKADATGFVLVSVDTGTAYTRPEWLWEEPDNWKKKPANKGKTWQVPAAEVDRRLDEIMASFNIIGAYADPYGFETYIAKWERKYGRRFKVKMTVRQPMTAWPRGKNTNAVEAVEVTRKAIKTQEATHNGSPSLERHALNARMRPAYNGYLLFKQYPQSPKKIDLAYAWVLAWKCRLDAIGLKGAPPTKKPRQTKQHEVVVLS